MSELLDEPFAPAALVLTEQHGAEFGELVGAVLENAKDRFQRGDGERQNLRFPVVTVLEPFCCVVESGVSESAGDLRAPAAEQPGRSPARRFGLPLDGQADTLRLSRELEAKS